MGCEKTTACLKQTDRFSGACLDAEMKIVRLKLKLYVCQGITPVFFANKWSKFPENGES